MGRVSVNTGLISNDKSDVQTSIAEESSVIQKGFYRNVNSEIYTTPTTTHKHVTCSIINNSIGIGDGRQQSVPCVIIIQFNDGISTVNASKFPQVRQVFRINKWGLNR